MQPRPEVAILARMLVELTITDLALIEQAELCFRSGFNVITGETGAGKSLLIDALGLLLGRRGKSNMVRQGSERARVEGRFLLLLDGYGERVSQWMQHNLPDTLEEGTEEGESGARELELILTRTVSRDGRGRAHVNHRPVTQKVLRELAEQLVEIHGQHEHQTLFEAAEQRRLVDTFGHHESALAGYRERRAQWLALLEQLESFERDDAERLQRIDLLRFQLEEFTAVDPKGEADADLISERDVLRHASELGAELGGLVQRLSDGEGAALDNMRAAQSVLDRWRARFSELDRTSAALNEAVAQLEEAAIGLSSFTAGLEADPARLDRLEARLDKLERLSRKHRTDAVGLLAKREELETELSELEGRESTQDEAEQAATCAFDSLRDSGERLSKARAKLGTKLRKSVCEGLKDLGLERATFDLRVKPFESEDPRRRWRDHGGDEIELLLAANPGEALSPLREVASGGEMARVLLALRGALAAGQSTPTLIFDEVDAGVGGRLGPKVASHLADLSNHHQVLCVTHLPAIAARANGHLKVSKATRGGRTRTRVLELDRDERISEIADMIAGKADSKSARAEAKRLLAVDA
ncbi:MAG: DNA repair protein RecN (Recombination protein N) [Planctomycetota bacterium]